MKKIKWPEKITSHLHPVFFNKETTHLDTDALQRAFREGANYMLDECKRVVEEANND